ncbi:HlyC/CorC family transporter [Rickettsia endosymbiont of Cardiosporidium cionae]|uniref:HlyC/CorC family transporter n=1 Tax=Rickettsia endosymbiont of Cardiosporidium cionae TaxID=2777155 RepID=UPI0018950603|nr:CNNM domain-containing protein [Rickettsia endosymbiont of Cardiosporidium cionae]KAF8818233.1 HlyC/CorC family transporter [Rickettsia endosymbiont of Cardiosporidium cionae]
MLSSICIFIFLFISAAISAIETAITATSTGKIQKLHSTKNPKAKILLNILRVKNKIISILLIGNNVINILCTTLATALFIDLLGNDIGTIVSSIIMSVVIIIFAEILPKTIAVKNPEKIALFVSSTLKYFLTIFQPANIVLDYFIRGFCFLFRINLKHEFSAKDEVEGLIEHHVQEGHVLKYDKDMIEAVLNIRNIKVSEIMTHRSSIFDINISLPFEKITEIVSNSSYTRIPVWKDNRDNIVGIIHTKDFLNKIHWNKNRFSELSIKNLLIKPLFILENVLLIDQLKAFRKGKSHIACIVNEYGDFQGIVTLEDILEEIVGQIYDEYDFSTKKIITKSKQEFIIDGLVSIRDINRELNWNLPKTEGTTIAGFIINKMKRIPQQGEFLLFENLKIVITKKSFNSIKTVKVILQDQPQSNNEH